MNSTVWSLSILIIINLIQTTVFGEIHDIPPIVSEQDHEMRLDEISFITEPNISLSKVYKRQVTVSLKKIYQKSSYNQTKFLPFEPCGQTPPEISFSLLGYYELGWTTQSNDLSSLKDSTRIINDYTILKSQFKNIIDMAFYSDHIFTISSSGMIKVFRVSENTGTGVLLRQSVNAIDWMQLMKTNKKYEKPIARHIGRGYFEFMDGNQFLIFASAQFLIGFDVRTFKATLISQQPPYGQTFTDSELLNTHENQDNETQDDIIQNREHEYTILENFQSVTKLDEDHFAVLDRKKGAIIYRIHKQPVSENSVQLNYFIKQVEIINKQKFGKAYFQNQKMNLVDIRFNKKRNLLYILDYNMGVFTFQRQSVNVMNEENSTFVLNQNIILKKRCNMMEFSQNHQTLYLSCNKIYRIALHNWPKIQEKTYPHPMINIRQIYIEQDQDLIVLAGYSVFKVLYLDRPVSYFQDDLLDKIIFDNGMAITANEYSISAFKYTIQKPLIQCYTNNRSDLGTHNIVVKTTAECQKSYLQTINRTQQQKSKWDEDDICIYTVSKNVYIWEHSQIEPSHFYIGLYVLLATVFLIFVWLLCNKCRLRKAMKLLQSYKDSSHAALVEQHILQGKQTTTGGEEVVDSSKQMNQEKSHQINASAMVQNL